MVSVSDNLIGSQEAGRMPLPPKAELQLWYQYYFATEHGRVGYKPGAVEIGNGDPPFATGMTWSTVLAVTAGRNELTALTNEQGPPPGGLVRATMGVRPPEAFPMPGKRVQFDEETWQALDLLGRDSMKTFQELADEAFGDLLTKHGRPTDLKTALRRSLPEGTKTAP